MKPEFPPTHLDIKAFAHAAGHIAGHDVLSNYERLMEEALGPQAETAFEWAAQGDLRSDLTGGQQIWLHLTIHCRLPLTCQRCLAPVEQVVAVDQWYRFVEGEEAAAAQDDACEEDVLALSRDFNLATLVEDEVLLALPLIPLHETCPVAVKLAVADPEFAAALDQQRNPFAVLSKLQTDKHH